MSKSDKGNTVTSLSHKNSYLHTKLCKQKYEEKGNGDSESGLNNILVAEKTEFTWQLQ